MSWPFDHLLPLSADLGIIDPPWEHEMWSEAGYTSKSARGQYETMSFEEIEALPVASLFRGDGVLWCWATHAMIDRQIATVRKWGFKFSTTGVWVKRTKHGKLGFGTGQRLRCASEPFIIATLGAPRTMRNVRTVVEGPVRQHSEKPDEAYAAAEALYPRALVRVDIFSRQNRPGWQAWGREKGKFDALRSGNNLGMACDDAQDERIVTVDTNAKAAEAGTSDGLLDQGLPGVLV